jgi:hypothetical protein
MEQPSDKDPIPLVQYQALLTAEYNYLAQSAFQSDEDRSRASQFFLIAFGTFLVAIFSIQYQNTDPRQLYAIFSLIFTALAAFGALTVLQLTRLRQAWTESIRAMDTLKNRAVQDCPDLGECFRWKTDTIPAAFKPWSISFLMALQVAIVSGLAAGAAFAFFALARGSKSVLWGWSILIGIAVGFGFMMALHVIPLMKRS